MPITDPAALKTYLAANRAAKARHNKAYRDKNRAALLAYNDAYYVSHPAKRTAKLARHKAQKINAVPVWETAGDRAQIRAWYDLAAMLGAEVDHIVPLRSANVCGLHVPHNLQIMTHDENAAKSNRLILSLALSPLPIPAPADGRRRRKAP